MPGLKRRGLETERQTGVTVTGVAQPTGKPAEHEGPRTYHTGEATAPVPDPTQLKDLLDDWGRPSAARALPVSSNADAESPPHGSTGPWPTWRPDFAARAQLSLPYLLDRLGVLVACRAPRGTGYGSQFSAGDGFA
jgi:hypothetical protein